MSCQPERVTGYVDDALDAVERAAVEEHLTSCPDCRRQVDEERRVRERLARLPLVEPRPGFELALRSRLRRRSPWRVLLPLAAALAVMALWARGLPSFVSYEVALDHHKCFSRDPLPATVWSADSATVARWFAEHGTPLPRVPRAAGGVELVGARYCPLIGGSSAPHLYYSSESGAASLFVVPRTVRVGDAVTRRHGSLAVRVLHVGGHAVAIVSDDARVVESFERALSVSLAWLADVAPVVDRAS